MTIAELYGKISRTGANLNDQMEDLLTSDVFSACKYVRPSTLLLPFLRTSIDLDGITAANNIHVQARDVEYQFWPMLTRCEPDLLICIHELNGKHTIVMIEAKYYSAKSGAAMDAIELDVAQTPSDQLAVEYLDLLHAHQRFGLRADDIQYRCLVYLTAHRVIPRHELQVSTIEISHFITPGSINLLWTSWFKLYDLLEEKPGTLPWEKPILHDLRLLLERKRLIMFQGFRPLTRLNPISNEEIYAHPHKSYFENIKHVTALKSLYQKGTS
jgi:hypothetical protein